MEISTAVADGPYSVIMDQVTNGVALRMAVLCLLAARSRPDAVAETDGASEIERGVARA